MLDALPHRGRRLHRDVGGQRAGLADDDQHRLPGLHPGLHPAQGGRVQPARDAGDDELEPVEDGGDEVGPRRWPRRVRPGPAVRAARRARPPPRPPARARRPLPARRRRRGLGGQGDGERRGGDATAGHRPAPGQGAVGQQRDERVGDGQGALAGEGRGSDGCSQVHARESTNERSTSKRTVCDREVAAVSPAWPSSARGRHGRARAGASAPAWPLRPAPRRRQPHRRRSPPPARRGVLLGLEVLERRRRHPRLPVLVEVAHDVGQPVRRRSLGQVDGHDVGVDVDGVGLAGGEQPAGQLGRRARTERLLRRAEVLVAHPRQRPVELEAHHAGRRARLLGDRDQLTHRPGAYIRRSADRIRVWGVRTLAHHDTPTAPNTRMLRQAGPSDQADRGRQ